MLFGEIQKDLIWNVTKYEGFIMKEMENESTINFPSILKKGNNCNC